MKKLIFIITTLIFLFNTKLAEAVEYEVASSATISRGADSIPDERAKILKSYLESHSSPLAPYADAFITQADQHGLPWTWVVAISGVESTFGKHIPHNSYNAWGWANGAYNFQGWEGGIAIVTKALKTNYVDRGADTISKIAPIYAPPSTTWASKVTYFISKIENFNSFDITELPISL